jgi:hypothetical protein
MPKLTLNIDSLSVDSFSPTPDDGQVLFAPTNPNLSLGQTDCFNTCDGSCNWSVCYTCNTCQSCLPTCRLSSEPCDLTG